MSLGTFYCACLQKNQKTPNSLYEGIQGLFYIYLYMSISTGQTYQATVERKYIILGVCIFYTVFFKPLIIYVFYSTRYCTVHYLIKRRRLVTASTYCTVSDLQQPTSTGHVVDIAGAVVDNTSSALWVQTPGQHPYLRAFAQI
jgi:hypothetical protein